MFAPELALNIVGISLFCWSILALMVFAFPLFVAASVSLAALDSGAGVLAAVLFGIATAELTN